MSNTMQLPVIAGIQITTDSEGRFNLNALHNASGSEPKNRPSLWLGNKQAQGLIEELSRNSSLGQSVINSFKGGATPGTFAHELLAISYAGWISPAFQLKVNQVFLDYRTGKLAAPQLPQTFAEALRLAAQLEEDKLLAEGQRDEAIRTKAQIGSRREAVAMATASVATRRVNKLEEQLGVNEQWKQVKAIPWLREFFVISRVMYQQVGRKLSAISSELGLKPKEVEDSAYGKIKAYHVDVVGELYRKLMVDAELMNKYRIV